MHFSLHFGVKHFFLIYGDLQPREREEEKRKGKKTANLDISQHSSYFYILSI